MTVVKKAKILIQAFETRHFDNTITIGRKKILVYGLIKKQRLKRHPQYIFQVYGRRTVNVSFFCVLLTVVFEVLGWRRYKSTIFGLEDIVNSKNDWSTNTMLDENV